LGFVVLKLIDVKMVFFSYQRLGFDKCLLARSLFDTALSVPPLERSPALDAFLADL
jgi:hypothetical protein